MRLQSGYFDSGKPNTPLGGEDILRGPLKKCR